MTRARNVTPLHTARRIARINSLITTLLERDLARDEVASLLEVTPSGVRKYMTDLGGRIRTAQPVDGVGKALGPAVYTLAITAEEAQAYLAGLAKNPPTRAAKHSKSAMSIAMRDSTRHIHIMKDDVNYPIRVSRVPPMRDPLVAAFFGAGRHEVRV